MIPKMQNFLEESARLYSKKIAVSFLEKSVTFSELHSLSNNLAISLQQQGVKRGDRVILLLGNTIETIVSFWAVLKTGAIVVPVGTEIKPNKLSYIIEDSGATILITDFEIVEQHQKLLIDSKLTSVIVVNQNSNLDQNFFKKYEIAIREQKDILCSFGLISIDLAAILYTSGSTGEPKGVMLSHENMIAATSALNTYLNYQKQDKVLCALPLSFDYGLYQMIMCISQGATLVLEKEFTWPIFLLKRIIKEKVTILPAVPTMIMLLYEQNIKHQLELSSVRMVTNTGAALTKDNIDMIKKLFPDANIFSMYGLTECKRCTYLPPAEIDNKPNSVGIPIPNTELWLVDQNNHRITSPNTVGQLVIRGANVMQGYWNKPEKTAQKLKEGMYPGEKVLYTGDFCTLDEDGYLYFKGRMDHMINSRGIKVSPKEVEDFITNIPGVHSTVITGVPHEDYGEALFAFVVLENEETISKKEILVSCHKHLEHYKIPEYIHLLSTIPKTPNGKFDIVSLKKKALEMMVTNVASISV
ncbi:class I adenylate-forming enzyme family protein [Aquimarina acroporae]|uniref:class I adenylate-forming enzyme family protein n=1 Tax=Aquimarina acroporae TaxID=2937283 RepID=UPI0020BDA2D8|nr:class I adenylate-forming enzyme family protein [Aquimarina acroporae]